MSSAAKSISAETALSVEPTFPPLLTGHRVEAGADPFLAACRAAEAGDAEAGDLYWSPSETALAVALVMEPEVPAGQVMDMLFVAMVAFGDSVGALAPPEVGIAFTWPQTLLANGARVGTASVGLPHDARPDDIPDWMVIALKAEIYPRADGPEPGLYVDQTTLWDEGCGELSRTELVESLSRHLKTWIHNWEIDGARSVRETWLARSARPGETVSYIAGGKEKTGTFLGLDEAGNMLVKTGESTIVAELASHLHPEPFSPVGQVRS